MRLHHPPPFAARWRARWIWFEPPRLRPDTLVRPVLDEPADRVGLLRRSFELDAVPAAAPCRVWADGTVDVDSPVPVVRG